MSIRAILRQCLRVSALSLAVLLVAGSAHGPGQAFAGPARVVVTCPVLRVEMSGVAQPTGAWFAWVPSGSLHATLQLDNGWSGVWAGGPTMIGGHPLNKGDPICEYHTPQNLGLQEVRIGVQAPAGYGDCVPNSDHKGLTCTAAPVRASRQAPH